MQGLILDNNSIFTVVQIPHHLTDDAIEEYELIDLLLFDADLQTFVDLMNGVVGRYDTYLFSDPGAAKRFARRAFIERFGVDPL